MRKKLFIVAALSVAVMSALPLAATENVEGIIAATKGPLGKPSAQRVGQVVYTLTKAHPEKADLIFRSALARRDDWSANDIYNLMRAMLMARPDLTEALREAADNYQSKGNVRTKLPSGGRVAQGEPGVYRLLDMYYLGEASTVYVEKAPSKYRDSDPESVSYSVLDALYGSDLPSEVVDQVLSLILAGNIPPLGVDVSRVTNTPHITPPPGSTTSAN